jgi:hypothetical protein
LIATLDTRRSQLRERRKRVLYAKERLRSKPKEKPGTGLLIGPPITTGASHRVRVKPVNRDYVPPAVPPPDCKTFQDDPRSRQQLSVIPLFLEQREYRGTEYREVGGSARAHKVGAHSAKTQSCAYLRKCRRVLARHRGFLV